MTAGTRPRSALVLVLVLVGCAGPAVVDSADGSVPVDAWLGEADARPRRDAAGSPRDGGGADAPMGCNTRGGDGDDDGFCAVDDCDDHEPSVHPGAAEICDRVDQDCDPSTAGELDADGDGETSDACCHPTSGGARCGNDCDDTRSSVSPRAEETCSLVDDDCDGAIDEGGVCGACAAGYRPDGAECVDIDECAAGASACHPARACVNAVGSYACGDCAPGYRNAGDRDCEDIDECVEGVGEGASTERACDVRRTCANAPGTFSCGPCAAGYMEDGPRSCVDVDECLVDNGGCEETCVDVEGSRRCECPAQHVLAPDRQECLYDGRLSALVPSVGDLSPAFAPGVTTYEIVLPDGVSTFTLTPSIPVPGGATIRVADRPNESGVASAPFTVPIGGVQDVRIDVQAESGRFTSYLVAVHARIVALSAGGGNTCALLADGGARCWGGNAQGQVGDGTTTERRRGTMVVGLTEAVELAVGSSHVCARRTDQTVWCWGSNTFGQLGDGSGVSHSSPTRVPGLGGVVELGAGTFHTCARLSDGTVRCWGSNNDGQIGDGTTTERTVPTRVSDLAGARGLALGSWHTCALLDDGTARCWGENEYGRLGDGTDTPRPVPTPVTGLTDVVELSAGELHSCARRMDGTMWCWGYGGHGRLGTGTGASSHTPVVATVSADGASLSDVAEIATARDHTCARFVDGSVRCWGYNGWGQIGDGTTTTRLSPTAFSLPRPAIGIDTAGNHSCVLLDDGSARCWGGKNSGQVGDGSYVESRPRPSVVNVF